MIARHGDLSFHPIAKLPKDAVEVKHNSSFVLALGEHTGHKHVITAEPDTFKVYQHEGNYILELKAEAKISHEEHHTITLRPGIYIQKIEQEYDPFLQQINKVQD